MVQTDINEKRCSVNVSPESGNVVASFLADEDEGAYALSEVTDGDECMKEQRDPLFEEASRYAKRKEDVTTSELQRKFAIGYIRANRLLAQLKSAGVVKSEEDS